MADYHVMGADRYGNTFSVAAHFPVADVENEVGYPYQVAIVEWQGGADNIESAVPFIEEAELLAMKAGEVYERVTQFYSHPGETLVEKRARLDLLYGAMEAQVAAEVGAVLAFWGYSRVVP